MKSPLSAATPSPLPMPDADALAHSAACAAMLRGEIERAGGWLSFARVMELALYAPGLGYYAAGARKFGAAGDFITAPEISPLFGQCVARSLVDALRETGGDMLELGPGSGRLAHDMLLEFAALGVPPRKYFLLEVSADLRERQRALLAQLPADLRDRVEWLDRLPSEFDGAIVANEVLDVVPVHLLHFLGGGVFERGVALENGAFCWRDAAALPRELEEPVARIRRIFSSGVPDGYVTEVAPAVDGLVVSLAGAMKRGVVLLIDYGFREAEFYHPDRRVGTLMCHYRHYAHTDPFLYPGLQDITAHVDFTAVAEAAHASGLDLVGYTSQAQFLLQAGMADLLSARDASDAGAHLRIANQAQRLLSPAEMGEFFKVIGFARGGVSIAALADARPLAL